MKRFVLLWLIEFIHIIILIVLIRFNFWLFFFLWRTKCGSDVDYSRSILMVGAVKMLHCNFGWTLGVCDGICLLLLFLVRVNNIVYIYWRMAKTLYFSILSELVAGTTGCVVPAGESCSEPILVTVVLQWLAIQIPTLVMLWVWGELVPLEVPRVC